jgi:hypothetical protein
MPQDRLNRFPRLSIIVGLAIDALKSYVELVLNALGHLEAFGDGSQYDG